MNVSYSFNQEETKPLDYYFFEKGFSEEDLKVIETNVSNLPWEEAVTEKGKDEIRKSRIKWIPQNDEWWWLYERLANMAVEANNTLWRFDLQQIPEWIQYTEYHAPTGHYDWHVDIGAGIFSKRKVSITVQLSDPSDYEGGNLELFQGGDIAESVRQSLRKQGCVCLFPSYLMHRVTPVTKGIRKSFVLWLGGGHYR